MNSARFITVEGGEGVGKSSFCREVIRQISALGTRVVSTREPGGTAIADQIRQIFMRPPIDETLQPETELCLVSAARMQHVTEVIQPALVRGEWVVCDRFADSSRVYQGEVGGVASDTVENFIAATTNNLRPDLTFLLDCSPDIARGRLEQRGRDAGEISRFDAAQEAHHRKIRDGFLNVSKRFSNRFVVIDASKPVAESVSQAVAVLKQRGWLG